MYSKEKYHGIYKVVNKVPSYCQSNVLVSFSCNHYGSVFEAECNHCSDRETCLFYRFPKDLKNSHDGWQMVLNRHAFVPLAYAISMYQYRHHINLKIVCHDNLC